MQDMVQTVISELSKNFAPISLVRNIKSGKEADVFLVESAGQLFALKIYKPNAQLASRGEYNAGRHIREKSLRKAIIRKNKVGKELMRRIWTRREFYMLKKFYDRGAKVPCVFAHTDEAILMEYLGDEQTPAPRLIDIKLTNIQQSYAYGQIMNSVQVFLQNGVVHGDLSAYNILWWQDNPYIIDFPQAVDVKRNPNWRAVLERDLQNISNYFGTIKPPISSLSA